MTVLREFINVEADLGHIWVELFGLQQGIRFEGIFQSRGIMTSFSYREFTNPL